MLKSKKSTRVISIILILGMLLGAFLPLLKPIEVNAAGPEDIPIASGSGFDVFIDSDNNVCIVTNDQIKAGSIYYRTIGFSISRGQFNPSARKLANGAATEYFELLIDRSYVTTYQIGSREINIFRYPFSTLLSKMSASWQQEIQDAQERGMTAYVRFDAEMVVMRGRSVLPKLYINTPPAGPYDDENQDRNPKELQNAQPWRAGAKTGIKTHYHRWLPISSSSLAALPAFTDWHVTKQEGPGPGVDAESSSLTYCGDYTGEPEYAGGNANLEGYNAALGIPSTKTVTGYAESSPWFGNIDVWARLVTHQYKKTDTYTWTVGEGSASYATPQNDPAASKAIKDVLDGIDEIVELEQERLKPLLADGHDTPMNEIFHYYFKSTFVDDAGNTYKTVTIGTPNPTVSDKTYSLAGANATYQWQYGWSWSQRVGYEQKWHDGWIDEYDEEHDGYFEDDYSRPIYQNRTSTWRDHTNPDPRPSGDGIKDVSELKKVGLKSIEWKVTAIDVRKYYDDNFNTTADNKVQAYVSFLYIDPYKTNIYDLNSVSLYNDAYDSMSFPQVVDTETDIQKASMGSESTVPFDAWLEEKGESAEIGSKDIATEDYVKWAEIEDEDKNEKLTKKYTKEADELRNYISENTKTMNDFVYVKNPIDLGPEDGVYLGNSQEKEYGIVTGCDFRDAETMTESGFAGYESIAKDDSNLSGTANVVTDDEIYTSEDNMSKYWYLCIHSAGGDVDQANAYIEDNESKLAGVIKVWEKLGYQTQNIEPETANGEHSTGISTLYVQEMVGPAEATTVMQYTDELVDGHLYSEEFGCSGETLYSNSSSRWGGCMGSEEGPMDESGNILPGPGSEESIDGAPTGDVSFIVDPIQIHTPIMSPGTIVSNERKKTDRESGATTTNYDGTSVPTSTTSLYNDISRTDTSQLRLDQYYYIKWQDLSEIGRTHRQVSTPEYGGYAGQTDNSSTAGLEEDQFTKEKYFKFPFEVMYDGKYYKANQWIKVKNPNNYSADGSAADNDEGYLRDANPETANTSAEIPGELTSENHWVLTPFYIPAWATEGLYEDIRNSNIYAPQDLDTCAQLRVDAINISETDLDGSVTYRHDEIQELANTYYNISSSEYDDGAAYVAQFNYPVQLSGWIYDFTITGISDIDNFGTNTWGATGDEEIGTQTTEDYFSHRLANDYVYSFTAHGQDKKSGLRNRLGLPGIRYLRDGDVNMAWDEVNTIALVGAWAKGGAYHPGKSNSWPAKGSVVKGTTFSFTLKTMSNMWNFNDKDSIVITPTFAYHKYDMANNSWINRENSDLKVYYDESSDENIFIPYGSDRDLNLIQKAYLNDGEFDQSYYDEYDTVAAKTFGDWVFYNVYNYNLRKGLIPAATTLDGFRTMYETDPEALLDSGAYVPETWVAEEIDEYCLSGINIPERMRLLSGEADQLAANNLGTSNAAKSRTDLIPDPANPGQYIPNPNFVTPRTYVGSDYGKEYETDFDSENNLRFKSNTQPTYESYEGASKVEREISMDDKYRYAIQSWYGQYYVPQELHVIDLTEHPEFRDFTDSLSPYYHSVNGDGTVTIDGNKYWDYMEYYITNKYLNGSSVDEDDEVFLTDGYLAVNFDIVAVKNGESHLVYDGGNIGIQHADLANHEEEEHPNEDNKVWHTEEFVEVPDDLDPPTINTTPEGVPTDEGDVVVIKLDEKFKDRFKAAIFNIN